ncbi:hypothetical protein M0R45_013617 [Rubus argutus]|uniref:Protein TIFY n=1 Tax=Rubus argutus TaxID=59490 RepID=A0AAW1XLN5_RUBAR
MVNCSLELRLPSSSHYQSSQDLQRQQLTIFYNGVMCVCDVTELQARAILCSSPVAAAAAGVSIKKSLQRFLQKRKHRRRATHPYNAFF